MIRSFLISYFLPVIVILSLPASGNSANSTSSLHERLDRLREQAGPGDTQTTIPECRAIMEEARRVGDKKTELTAEALLGHLENYRGNAAEGYRLLNDALHKESVLMERGLKTEDLRALIYSGLAQNVISSDGNYYLGKEYYLRAARAALQAGDLPLQHYCIINLMRAGLLYNDTDLEKEATSTLEWAQKTGDIYAEYHTLCYLANIELKKGNIVKAEKYQNMALQLFNRHNLKNKVIWLMTQAEILEERHDLPGALSILENAREYMKKGTEPKHFSAVLASRIAAILMLQKNYEEARVYAEEAYRISIETQQKSYLGMILHQLTEIADRQGDTALALSRAIEREQFLDTTMTKEKEALIQNLGILYNLDKKDLEIQTYDDLLRRERERNLFLWITVGLLLLLTCGVILALCYRERYHKRLVSLAKTSATRDKRLLSYQSPKENNVSTGKTVADHDSTDTSGISYKSCAANTRPEAAEVLCRRLMDHIEKSSDWSDRTLSRDAMSETLDTNRTYLSKAVKDYTGMTYAQFINHLRINRAIEILSDTNRNEYPLKAICSDLGFGSMNAFYSNFKNATGLSPAAFRKNN